MTYTKEISRHDRVTIDGTDVSNACRSFGRSSEKATVEVPGFSVSGTVETLSGANTEGFTGDIYYTKEIEALLLPLFESDTVFEVAWQPNGLVDNTRTTHHGNCQLRSFSPTDTFGDVPVWTATFAIADSAGITTT